MNVDVTNDIELNPSHALGQASIKIDIQFND